MTRTAPRTLPTRIMHTMIRVSDLERSIRFYELLGMRQLRRHDFPTGRFSIVMMGYGAEEATAALELTHNWDTPSYALGTGYGHIAVAAEDVGALCAHLTEQGVKVVRAPGPMRGGPTLAFLEDPDGYRVEVIEIDSAHPLGRYSPNV
jgi:lactoylglutathione lyase